MLVLHYYTAGWAFKLALLGVFQSSVLYWRAAIGWALASSDCRSDVYSGTRSHDPAKSGELSRTSPSPKEGGFAVSDQTIAS